MQKLELTWIGKGSEPAVEPRILLHDASKDYGDPAADNMLIHGDNLLALKALEQEFAGRVKCIYIDPPYNTGSAFEHYDDNLEHSTWLSLMKPRLDILRNLLSDDGSIWISIDDDEGHYLKVLCDEIFGRQNFINTVIWQKKFSPQNDAKWLSDSHDFLLVYAKEKSTWRPNLLPRTAEMDSRYQNLDNDPRGPWSSSDMTVKTYSAEYDYEITTPSGRKLKPTAGRCWNTSKENFQRLVDDNRVWFGENGNNVPRLKRFLTDVKAGITAMTLWTYQEVGHNQDARKEVIAFNSESVFATPKPERLIERVLTLGSNPGDLVLDSFLGSGTTAAVAHKMGRRWIGIELGDHCYTHCLPRLKAVVDGEQGGVSKSVNWQGGGGFKFYELAPTLIVKDRHGNPIIDTEKYNPEMLAAAVAKLNGFAYAPDPEVFWKQGKNVENSYIYVTTQYLTARELDHIARDLPDYEKLLICAPAFDIGLGKRYENIDVRKIPQSVLDKCEFGIDNYNLNIVNPPELDEEEWDDAEQ
ncbi:site-specific DNA-methyltransferase [Pelotomaculum propionicicum]|uniref:Modification methylase MboII n=1 Tax=Pelotomaculum propionicicum TaxID=258475 RepID=A0A4Y7RK15_9FIRM|nr:site-specific DNA-methyltransferase [Pelotomaculum propionicicum]TEB09166.1 Modification methylase MboII [Pelotomaculum propionicicum]